jgi:hypothetical protein
VHDEPQLAGLLLDKQLLLQRCVPGLQLAQTWPEQYRLAQSPGTRHPAPFGHVFPCATQPPPQSTPVSSWFLIASLQESATQAPPLEWNPALQETNTQVPFVQVPTPLA